MSEQLDYEFDYEMVIVGLEDGGCTREMAASLLAKVTTAAVIDELKRLLTNAAMGAPLTSQILARITELEARP